jgi:hypothetical protein
MLYIYIYIYIYEALGRSPWWIMWPSCGLELAIPAVHKQNTFLCPQFLNFALFLQNFMTPMRASGMNRETSPPIGPHVPASSSWNHQSPAARSKNTSTTGILHIPSQENINHAKDGWNNRSYNFQVGPALPPQLVSHRLWRAQSCWCNTVLIQYAADYPCKFTGVPSNS